MLSSKPFQIRLGWEQMGMANTLAYYDMATITVVKIIIILSGNPHWRGRLSTVWPPCTNQFRSAPFDIENIIYFLTKNAALLRRSTVLSLPLQLVFPGTVQLPWPLLMLYNANYITITVPNVRAILQCGLLITISLHCGLIACAGPNLLWLT
jgi:hypothetical protein